MAPRLSERWQAVFLAAAFFAAVTVLYTTIQAMQPPPVAPRGTLQVTLHVDGGTWNLTYGPVVTLNNTVFGILLEAADRHGFEVGWVRYEVPEGVFVTSINATTNGQSGKFWQYWVNGQIGEVAADRKELFDEDYALWKFDVPQAGA